VVLATQNPVDLDYKGLGNMGTWMVGRLQTERDRDRLRDGLLGVGVEAKTLDQLLAATRKRVFLLHDVHRPGPVLMHSRWVLSYLRGPLTRDEVSRLAAGRPGSVAAAPAAAAPGPPVLPAPLEHHYLSRYGSPQADPYLMVKYAVRYKGAGEVVAFRAWPLAGESLAEVLEAEPMDVDESAVSGDPPAGIRYAALPGYLAEGGRAIERLLKERLPDKLALTVWSDPVTRTVSLPGEDRETFVARLRQAGGGAGEARLRERLEKKRRELKAREEDLAGRKSEKWAALGTAILSNIGILTGRKRTLSGAGGVLSKHRMENTAEARVEALKAEVAAAEEALGALVDVDPARLEEKPIVPSRSEVKVLRYDLVWVR
jgi:hypothetical protein